MVSNSDAASCGGFIFQSLMIGLIFDIIEDLIQQVGEKFTDVIVSDVCIATIWTIASMCYIENFYTCAC